METLKSDAGPQDGPASEGNRKSSTDEYNLYKRDIDPNLLIILKGIGLNEEEINLFLDHDVKLFNLHKLTLGDLEAIGLTDPAKQVSCLSYFLNKKCKEKIDHALEPMSFEDIISVLKISLAHLKDVNNVLEIDEYSLLQRDFYMAGVVSTHHLIYSLVNRMTEEHAILQNQMVKCLSILEKNILQDQSQPFKSYVWLKASAVILPVTAVMGLVYWKMKS